MFMKSSKSSAMCTVCSIVTWIVMVLAALAVVASLVGVYKAHFLAGGATFGTTNGSLALISLVATLAFLMKMMMYCPCRNGK